MNSNPLLKTAVNFGAMSGLGSFAVFLGLFYKGINPLGNASWLGAWIPVVFICIATKIYRDHFLAGEISYAQAMKIGLTTALAASFLFALLVYIFTTLIDDNVISMYKNEFLQGMEETKFMFSDEMYDQTIANMDKVTIINIAFTDFLAKMFGALLVTLITAAFYRKQNTGLAG
ncbi:MAG TPA: DUF4199 domain-containing protein [Bacteroidia bacterium]|nr:DUF4199 domain-containing protein [Bacteroidia bacterium]